MIRFTKSPKQYLAGGECSVLVADPPWQFGDKLPGKSRGAEKNYAVLDLAKIKKFPLPRMAENSILFLWRVSSQVEEAYAVVRAWGFVPKSELVWRKLTVKRNRHFGMGRYVRAEHETCIIATRGAFKVADRGVRSVFDAPVGRHSEKPEEFYKIVNRLAPADGNPRRVELFARKYRKGWECYGDELKRSAPVGGAR